MKNVVAKSILLFYSLLWIKPRGWVKNDAEYIWVTILISGLFILLSLMSHIIVYGFMDDFNPAWFAFISTGTLLIIFRKIVYDLWFSVIRWALHNSKQL